MNFGKIFTRVLSWPGFFALVFVIAGLYFFVSSDHRRDIGANKLLKAHQEVLRGRRDIEANFPYEGPSNSAFRSGVTRITSDGVFHLIDGSQIYFEGIRCTSKFYTGVFDQLKGDDAGIIFDRTEKLDGSPSPARIWLVHGDAGESSNVVAPEFENGIMSGECVPVIASTSKFASRYEALRREYLRLQELE